MTTLDELRSELDCIARSNPVAREQVLDAFKALVADNAALLVHLNEMVRQAGEADTGTEDPDKAPGLYEYMLAAGACEEPHPGAALLADMAGLRKQVETLTAERDGFKRTAAMVSEAGDRLSVTTAALEAERDALRARVAELEAENERLARHHAERVDERNAAQQRAKVLEQQVAELNLPSPPPHPVGCNCTECYERAMRYIENGSR